MACQIDTMKNGKRFPQGQRPTAVSDLLLALRRAPHLSALSGQRTLGLRGLLGVASGLAAFAHGTRHEKGEREARQHQKQSGTVGAHHSTRVTRFGLKPRSAALPLRPRRARALLRLRISSVSSRS